MTLLSTYLKKTIVRFWGCLVVGLSCSSQVDAQTPVACNEITESMGFTVRSVKIEGKWVPQELQKKVEKIVGVGKLFSPTFTNAAIKEVETALDREQEIALNYGTSSILYVTSNTCAAANATNAKLVDISIFPYYVRVDLINIGRNILPMPRTNTPTFSAGVPPILAKIAPIMSGSIDRNYGSAINIHTSTNLLNLFADRNIPNPNGANTLNLNIDARRSLSQPFYNLDTALEYTRPSYSDGSGVNLATRYSNQLEPLGEGQNRREQIQFGGGIQGKSDRSTTSAYTIGGGLRFLNNSYTALNSNSSKNSETGMQLYAIEDMRIGQGFARFGSWLDAGFSSNTSSYQRLAIKAGYATQLGSDHNTVGLQLMAGSGITLGNPPEYSRFFGGATSANYLYESLNSNPVRDFPSGPILRSFGNQQAGLRSTNGSINGGDFYWHLNLDVSLPVPQWSQPLIPDVVTPRGDLRSSLKKLARSKANLIYFDLIDKRGFPDNEDTARIAERMASDVIPTVDYLADRANLYAVKPMLLFDVAQISGSSGSKLWTAAGAGVQVNIVNGKIETGYMQTISPATDSGIGNFFVRLAFDNF
jgi:Omp85 superfamily domain